jgi:hypothetical protein
MQMPEVYRLVEDLVEMHGAPHFLFSKCRDSPRAYITYFTVET